MRGKGSSRSITHCRTGITPAHAGKSVERLCPGLSHGDHPRTCGEKYQSESSQLCSRGSPPHMRGKAGNIIGGLPPLGITPAHAGKRCGTGTARDGSWDHPRTCGEKLTATSLRSKSTGSPPHMRGKACDSGGADADDGITPAHAGKSCFG